MTLKEVSPEKVLAQVAAAIPAEIHPNVVIIGSLAASFGCSSAAMRRSGCKLLASAEDLQEAAVLNANGLLSRRPATVAEIRIAGERLLTFAVDPLTMAR
jgi:hypothetical protein